MDALVAQYPWLNELLMGILDLHYTHVIMWLVGALLIFLAVKYDYEPALLLPIGFGAILANIPHSSAVSTEEGAVGFLITLYYAGIANELFPVLIFIAVGAMCDFAPLIRRPSVMLFAAAAQFGIFATAIGATLVGFSFPHAASIGIIGAADGPDHHLCSKPLCSRTAWTSVRSCILLHVFGSGYSTSCCKSCNH